MNRGTRTQWTSDKPPRSRKFLGKSERIEFGLGLEVEVEVEGNNNSSPLLRKEEE